MRGYIEGYIDPFGSVYFLAKKLSARQPEEKLKRQRLIAECEFINFGKNKNTAGSKFYMISAPFKNSSSNIQIRALENSSDSKI